MMPMIIEGHHLTTGGWRRQVCNLLEAVGSAYPFGPAVSRNAAASPPELTLDALSAPNPCQPVLRPAMPLRAAGMSWRSSIRPPSYGLVVRSAAPRR